ncbi:hypothetical protein CPAR01_14117 [Colletotrichum paranaense]|uniref:Uncharacterized protein n=5 Tax=Colletotrichum acutatum species complex TaxID=2707335 RepID=A0AAI9Z8L8_9PEZI|nr:hypothetical protein CSPX01_10531 [Colletotrichum filicis]KAK1462646.1 hypothetical protein CMEL01_13757 [Colletotrichum melonis]KAK1472681.1 hypothetical protein CABS01_16210 [Colletotrichum abscissum]KAK1490234.1 hypothetical protein CCUS01_14503 [Colletotrichum cuscutae]KAK1501425.1 hypothetical protein CTAM01_06150 [Colletotrichum tamarilloi]KAK1523264.1 hypothetical protein CPAR01_14117 [Colletotrichum paranaense]KAK1537456.1 hypothetical protein CCOS01_02776 [Colletotrichum costarice
MLVTALPDAASLVSTFRRSPTWD